MFFYPIHIWLSELYQLIRIGILLKVGAPRDSCNDLAPVILAFSNLVNLEDQ